MKPAGRAIIVAARPLLGVSKLDEGYNDKKRESYDQANETRAPSFHFSQNDYSTRAALKLTNIRVALIAGANNEYRNACWCLGPGKNRFFGSVAGIAASVGLNIPAGPAIIACLIMFLILFAFVKMILSFFRAG